LVAVGCDELDIADTDKAEDVPEVSACEIDLAAERNAARDKNNINSLSLQQPFGPDLGIAEGTARTCYLVDPRLERGGNGEIIDGGGDDDRVGGLDFADQ